ncbi:protein kinase [Phytophthora infestans T30-4]|uniref:GDP-D-glucose phosphorylase 1 n=1 Tax=Phytophthora infestans (strain T30-4) TaxID=403677 RepID=D0MXG7_PHYIT|nr:protein kinase [Phytophthora infestans T30-4]EEY64330.1 protein kinase [Phytophthora infestans T30-4]|eukprot:XP_002907766.1 protein kinase [Phytophthora infestans T30-4]
MSSTTSTSELFLYRWDLAESAGVIRTNVSDTIRRTIPGDLGLVIQFNPSHIKVRGHLLFVLELSRVKSQQMTKEFLLYALSISHTLHREDFALEPEDAVKDAVHVVHIAWALLELLQARGIPHNLLVVGTVLFVFPRQPQCENGVGMLFSDKSLDDSAMVYAGRLRVAVAELSGLIVAGDSVAYENLTEEMFNSILRREVSLSAIAKAGPRKEVIFIKHFDIHRDVSEGGFGKVNAVIRKKASPVK